jgi:ribosomal protein S27E
MALEHACSEATSSRTHSQPLYEAQSVDCPDCFDAMIRFYDWDSVRYLCENCGLTIANPVIHFFTSITEEQ